MNSHYWIVGLITLLAVVCSAFRMATTQSALPTLTSLRDAARRLRLPGGDLLALLEERGAIVYRLAGRGRRARYRIDEQDVLALLRDSRRPTASQARTRSQAIKEMVEAEVLGERAMTTPKYGRPASATQRPVRNSATTATVPNRGGAGQGSAAGPS